MLLKLPSQPATSNSPSSPTAMDNGDSNIHHGSSTRLPILDEWKTVVHKQWKRMKDKYQMNKKEKDNREESKGSASMAPTMSSTKASEGCIVNTLTTNENVQCVYEKNGSEGLYTFKLGRTPNCQWVDKAKLPEINNGNQKSDTRAQTIGIQVKGKERNMSTLRCDKGKADKKVMFSPPEPHHKKKAKKGKKVNTSYRDRPGDIDLMNLDDMHLFIKHLNYINVRTT